MADFLIKSNDSGHLITRTCEPHVDDSKREMRWEACCFIVLIELQFRPVTAYK